MASLNEWMYSKKNIAGCALALVGAPTLLITGLVTPPLALALIPAFYGIGALVAPSEKRESVKFANALSKVERDNIEESLDVILKSIHGSVSANVELRVQSIAQTITTLLPRAVAFGKTSEEVRILTRTATDYLPATINPYLALPRYYAEHTTVSDGKTAEILLCDQLDLIQAKLMEILEAIAANDTNAILANGQFLKDRFGTSGLTLGAE